MYIRMYGIDRFKLNKLKESLREKATLLYMVDRREAKEKHIKNALFHTVQSCRIRINGSFELLSVGV